MATIEAAFLGEIEPACQRVDSRRMARVEFSTWGRAVAPVAGPYLFGHRRPLSRCAGFTGALFQPGEQVGTAVSHAPTDLDERQGVSARRSPNTECALGNGQEFRRLCFVEQVGACRDEI